MSYQLAQLNIAIAKAPLDSPELADFVANIERINALAESSKGFVWRYKTPENDTLELELFGENCLVTSSVWQDMAALSDYVYHSHHTDIMRRRKEWFERLDVAALVLWWIPSGHVPTLQEARAKLDLLRAHGPSSEAFSFSKPYAAPTAS